VAAGPRPRAALGRAAPAPLRQARLNAGPLSGLLALLPYRPPRRPSFIPRRKEAPPGQPGRWAVPRRLASPAAALRKDNLGFWVWRVL